MLERIQKDAAAMNFLLTLKKPIRECRSERAKWRTTAAINREINLLHSISSSCIMHDAYGNKHLLFFNPYLNIFLFFSLCPMMAQTHMHGEKTTEITVLPKPQRDFYLHGFSMVC